MLCKNCAFCVKLKKSVKIRLISVIRVPFGILKDEIIEWILATVCYGFFETALRLLREILILQRYCINIEICCSKLRLCVN